MFLLFSFVSFCFAVSEETIALFDVVLLIVIAVWEDLFTPNLSKTCSPEIPKAVVVGMFNSYGVSGSAVLTIAPDSVYVCSSFFISLSADIVWVDKDTERLFSCAYTQAEKIIKNNK